VLNGLTRGYQACVDAGAFAEILDGFFALRNNTV
jgi:hypothetical protein